MNKRLPKSNLLSLSFLTKGSRGHFLLAFVLVILAVITGYLTPQVFRITVDSVLGDEPFSLPGALVPCLNHGADARR